MTVGNGGIVTVINNTGSSMVVDIINEGGSRATAYTDDTFSATHSLPKAITATTSFWVREGAYDVSVKANGVEVASTPDGVRRVILSNWQQIAFAPSLDDARVPDQPTRTLRISPVDRPAAVSPDDFHSNTVGTQLTLTTPDGFGEVVHTTVAFAPDGWNGYRYWLAATPYHGYDSVYENPCLWVSQDGSTWTVPPGVTNPIEPAPTPGDGYNSDPNLVFGPDGRLYCFFRRFDGTVPAAPERIYYRASSDGVDWSDKQLVLTNDQNVRRPYSPSVVYLDGTWYMFAVDGLATNPATLVRFTASSPTGPWSAPQTCTLAMPSGRTLWHIDVQKVGGELVALALDGTSGTGSDGGGLWLCKSTDLGLTWTRAAAEAVRRTGATVYYKGCILPVSRGGETGFECWYPSFNSLKVFRAFLSGRAREKALVAGQAAALARIPVSPYLVGDAFTRADSAVTPGTLDSGQAWSVTAGTLGISSQKMYAPAAANSKAQVSAGVADFYAEVAFAAQPAGGTSGWLMFRVVDGNNYWRLGHQGTYKLQAVVGGSITTDINLVAIGVNGDRIGARCSGTAIDVFLNGDRLGGTTSSTHQAGTAVGLQTDNTTTRFDEFYARSLVYGT